jgi:hypothetical protein
MAGRRGGLLTARAITAEDQGGRHPGRYAGPPDPVGSVEASSRTAGARSVESRTVPPRGPVSTTTVAAVCIRLVNEL